MEENKNMDKKSLKFLRGRNTVWDELAKDYVSFANAQGGSIFIGIEDKDSLPPANQKISDRNLPDLIQKNIANRTVNIAVAITIEVAKNKAELLKVQVFRNAQTIACTTDGKYYIRVHDECKPIPPDEMQGWLLIKMLLYGKSKSLNEFPPHNLMSKNAERFWLISEIQKESVRLLRRCAMTKFWTFIFFRRVGI